MNFCCSQSVGANRRDLLGTSLASAAIWTVGLKPVIAAGLTLRSRGCTGLTLSGAEMADGGYGSTEFDQQNGVSETSGDPRFDQLLGRMLADLVRHDGVRPSFAFYDDGGGMNAFASQQAKSWLEEEKLKG